MDIFGQVVAGLILAAIFGVFGWFRGWWGKWSRHRAKAEAPPILEPPVSSAAGARLMSSPAPVNSASREVALRLKHILQPFASQLAGIGHVMLTFGPPPDEQIRMGKIDELLADYDRMKDRLYELGDDRLVEDIRKQMRECRNDTLIRLKSALDQYRDRKYEHFGDKQIWAATFGAPAGSCEWRSKQIGMLVARLDRVIAPSATPLSSEGAWPEDAIKRIADDYWKNGSARCPDDGTPLVIEKSMTTSESVLLLVLCPRCNRKATNIKT